MASSYIHHGKQKGKKWEQWQILFSWAQKSLWMVTTDIQLKTHAHWKKSYDKLSILKRSDITLPTKICIIQGIDFPVVMYRCERWTIKKAEHQRIDTVIKFWLEKTWECLGLPDQPVNPKGNQPLIIVGKTYVKLTSSNLATWYKELTHWKRPWC